MTQSISLPAASFLDEACRELLDFPNCSLSFPRCGMATCGQHLCDTACVGVSKGWQQYLCSFRLVPSHSSKEPRAADRQKVLLSSPLPRQHLTASLGQARAPSSVPRVQVLSSTFPLQGLVLQPLQKPVHQNPGDDASTSHSTSQMKKLPSSRHGCLPLARGLAKRRGISMLDF